MSISLEGEGLLRQSLSILRECGANRHECVVIWTGPADGDTVTRVLHPAHTHSALGYRVHTEWVSQLYLELAERDERVIAQVHTHPKHAFHSRRDNAHPIVIQAGLYSLVIPRFATEPIDQTSWYLTQLQADGVWQQQSWVEVRE